MLPDDLWLRPILVAPHAASRILDRVGWRDDAEQRVAREVRLALLEGRVSETQPPWTHYSRTRTDFAKGRVYAWEASFVRCWVVQRQGRSEALIVVTVLLEQTERGVAAQRRRRIRA